MIKYLYKDEAYEKRLKEAEAAAAYCNAMGHSSSSSDLYRRLESKNGRRF